MSYFKLDTSQDVVSNFEVVELYDSNFLSNGGISAVFPSSEIIEIGNDVWIGLVWVSEICVVSNDRFAREFSRNHIMEDSQAVSSVRMTRVVSEFSNSGIPRTDVDISRRTHCVVLKIIPKGVSIRTTSMISNEGVVWMCNPETTRSCVCVQKRH